MATDTAPTLAAAPGPMVPTMYRIVSREQDLADTVTIGIEVPGIGAAPPAPGQFNMLWAFGLGEVPISVAGVDGDRILHTIRNVGAVTARLCDLVVGDEVGLRGPFGVGWDLDAAASHDVLVVAGGLGLAPVRPVIRELLARRAEFGRVAILVGARSPDVVLYLDELAQWRTHLDVQVEVTVDTASPAWRGDVGVVTKLLERAAFEPANTTAYVCGPEVMMRVVGASLVDRGVAPAQVQLSLERNMHCAIGHCGHCQLGPAFVCKDGPVLPWPTVEPLMRVRQR